MNDENKEFRSSVVQLFGRDAIYRDGGRHFIGGNGSAYKVPLQCAGILRHPRLVFTVVQEFSSQEKSSSGVNFFLFHFPFPLFPFPCEANAQSPITNHQSPIPHDKQHSFSD
jgi:hypothetical protein